MLVVFIVWTTYCCFEGSERLQCNHRGCQDISYMMRRVANLGVGHHCISGACHTLPTSVILLLQHLAEVVLVCMAAWSRNILPGSCQTSHIGRAGKHLAAGRKEMFDHNDIQVDKSTITIYDDINSISYAKPACCMMLPISCAELRQGKSPNLPVNIYAGIM
jgi:hypothetical protein